MTAMQDHAALGDLVVVDLSQNLWSGVAGAFLADFGAQVVHVAEAEARFDWETSLVEESEWDYLADLAQRNKRSLRVRLDDPQGAELANRLIARADILLIDWPRARVQAMGWDPETLCGAHPSLIYARCTPFGPRGPERDAPDFDALAAARSGVMPTLPQPGQPPVLPEAGGMFTSLMLGLGIMMAVHHRSETGEGQVVDASLFGANMYGASLELQAYLAMKGDNFLGPVSREDVGNPMSAALYKTRDERWVTLTMPDTDRWWAEFSKIMGIDVDDPLFDDHSKRTDLHRVEFRERIEAVLKSRDAAEWRALFHAKGLSADLVEKFDYPASDPVARQSRYIVERDDPRRGKVTSVGFPLYMTETPAQLARPAPAAGADSDQVLLDFLDIGRDEIDALRARGTLGECDST